MYGLIFIYMVRTVITPTKTDIHLAIPKNYIGKRIEITFFAIDELEEQFPIYMSEEFKIIQNWEDDLIMCPSQCILKFEFEEKQYAIYLRWRHHDPWTASLVKLSDEQKDKLNGEWFELNVNLYTHDQLDEIKNDAINRATEFLFREK